jgi:hypothetical protein
MLDSRSLSMFLQNTSFQNMSFSNMFSSFLNNEISRSFSDKCIYFYEENHLYKKKYVKFNENLKIERIHLQKRRIYFDIYNFEASYVRMISYKSQRLCIKNAKKLTYSNRVVAASIEVHIVRLKENAKIELFINEKKKIVFVNHEFYANVNIIFIVTRLKFKIFKKFVKYHEFIKRILKRKWKKKKNCSFQRFGDQKNEKKLRWKKKTMFEIELWKKFFRKTKKKSKNVEKRSRFAFDKEKVKIIKKIKEVKKIQKIVSLFVRKRILNKLRIIDI